MGADLVAPQPLYAHWALIGKVAGMRQDYNIRARSRGDVNVEEIAWEYVPGTPDPDARQDAPWAPPWLTFGAHAVSRRRVVSMSVLDRWQQLDQAGRPIWPRQFFACDYAALAHRNASYRTLAEALLGFDLEKQAGQPIELRLRPQSLDYAREGIEAAINSFGFQNLAGIAASLLEQPQVALSGTQMLTAEQRVQLLDCVAALLPYGCRAYLTASTSIDPKVGHTIRLVLTELPGDGQRELPLSTGMPSTPRGREAERYREMLMDRAGSLSVTAVVKHLWADKKLCPLQPGAALDRLGNLHRDEYRSARLRSAPSRADLRDALELLEGPADNVRQRWEREREADPRTPTKVLVTLLESKDPRAAETVRARRDIISYDLAALGASELSAGRIDIAERSLIVAGIAEGDQFADGLLGMLLTSAATPDAWRDEIRNRVLLLRKFPPPLPGRLPFTCDNLRYGDLSEWQAQLVRALLSAELASTETLSRAVGWAAWLGRSRFAQDYPCPAWVQALDFVTTDAADGADPAAVSGVISVDPHWMRLLLSLARQAGRLVVLLDSSSLDRSIIEMACRLGVDGAPDAHVQLRKPLADLLDLPLWETGARVSSVASIDVARVLLRSEPRDFPLDRSLNQFDPYLKALAQAIDKLPGEDWRRWVQQKMLDHVVGRATPSRRLSLAAVYLLEAWIADPGFAPGLMKYIKAVKLSSVLELDPRLSLKFWQILIADAEFTHLEPVVAMSEAARAAIDTPTVALARATRESRDVGTGERFTSVKPSTLSQAMFSFWQSGRRPEQILAAMAREWRKDKESDELGGLADVVPPLQLWQVLREFQGLIASYVPTETDPRAKSSRQVPDFAKVAEVEWAACLWLIVHGHVLGRKYGRAFQKTLDRQAKSGGGDYRQVKRIFSAGPFWMRADLPPQLLFRRWLGVNPPGVPSAPRVNVATADAIDSGSLSPPQAAGSAAEIGSLSPPRTGAPWE